MYTFVVTVMSNLIFNKLTTLQINDNGDMCERKDFNNLLLLIRHFKLTLNFVFSHKFCQDYSRYFPSANSDHACQAGILVVFEREGWWNLTLILVLKKSES